MDINPETVSKWFSEIMKATLTKDGDKTTFSIKQYDIDNIYINDDIIIAIINSLNKKHINGETTLYDSNNYEILVKEESHSFSQNRLREEILKFEDKENFINYEISSPSNDYLLYILSKFSEVSALRVFMRPVFMSSSMRARFDKNSDSIDALNFIKSYYLRYSTLKISTRKNSTLQDYNKLSTSLIFHLAYNLDLTIVPQLYIKDLIRYSKINHLRRSSVENLDPPRRTYNSSLVHHYQMATSTDSPFLEYLSYYHIMENYFESVFNDDLIEQIKHRLTSPDFSYKRNKDIKQLIKYIGKTIQFRNENMTFSEIEALKLTLIKYINISNIKSMINEYDSELIEYYKVNEISFSKGNQVDFTNPEEILVYNNLANRIYKTRNTLVHSKDGEKSKYTPFRDDRELINELPLMRFIAEQIILTNSVIIE